jgi:hypothetical protein
MSFVNLLVPMFQDSQGRPSSPALTLGDQDALGLAPYAALLAAMQACSSCNLVGVAQQIGTTAHGTGTPGTHPLATDQCRIQLVSSALTGFISIPGPVDAMFQSDGSTLNLAAPIVLALQSAIIGVLGDVQGNPWTSIVGGVRRQVALGPGGQ